MMSLLKSPDHVRFWFSFAFLGVPFIPYSIYLFSGQLRGFNGPRTVVHLGFIVCASLAVVGAGWPDLVCEIRDFSWGRFNYFKSNTIGLFHFSLVITVFAVFLALAAINFYKSWKEAPNLQEKVRYRNIFIAFIISYAGTADFAVTRGVNIYPIGFAALTVLIGIMAYTIIRHQFFEINVMIKRGSLLILIYSFLAAFAVPMAVNLLRYFFIDLSPRQMWGILFVGMGMAVILSMGPFIYATLIRRVFWLKGHLSRGLAHELKSPLGVIQSASEVIADGLSQENIDKEKLRYYSDMIKGNASRLETLTGDLLNVARMENEDFSVNRSLVNVADVTREVIHSFEGLYVQKGLTVCFETENELMAHVDVEKWKQIVSNLLSNAIKFSEKGAIHINLKSVGSELHFSIRDQGCGIPADKLGRIFDRFYKVDPGSKGSGIGLTIAKAWVEAHGGEIWVESEGEGKGTKVTFTVPV